MLQKTALIILDWFWLNNRTPEENAIVQASTPTFDRLFSCPFGKLEASGRAVWLPDGQMWNSEVWHTTLWTGRIIKQSLVAISDLFDEWKFAELEEFKTWINHVRENGSALHLLWLFGSGGVHSIDTHMKSMIQIIPSDVKTFLHLFLDWRDVPPQSALWFMKEFEEFLKDYPNVNISTIGGRYFWMDRDNNWDRVQKAYDEIVFQQTQTSDIPSQYIEKCYAAWEVDEFVTPVSFLWTEPIEDGDCVFFLNFRADRARQFTQALQVSKDEGKKDLYELNARRIVTVWGGNLTDYANRAWAGLCREYFYNRWRTYVNRAFSDADNPNGFANFSYNNTIIGFEWDWTSWTTPIPLPQVNDVLGFSRHLQQKYATQLQEIKK